MTLHPALHAAVVNSAFTGGDPSDNWNAPANWSPAAVPNNNATDQYEVTLPGGLPAPVNLNISPTLNSLAIGSGTTLLGQPSFGITLAGGLANDGMLELGGTASTARLFLDHPTDQAITLGGSGIVRLTGGSQNISGAIGQQLIHGASHTIEGFQTSLVTPLGNDRLNIVNDGTIRADVTGQFIALAPRDTFVNTGTLSATNGGILHFVSGAFSGSGQFRIGDGSEFASNSASFTNVSITAVDSDADDRNNIFRAINNGTVFSGVTLADGILTTTNNLPVTIAGELTNDGLIELTGTISSSRLFVDHPTDESITLGGSGTVRFTGGAQNITGPLGQMLVIGPDQTLEGFQTDVNASIGEGALNIVNQGTIQAGSTGQFLSIEARDTFVNEGTVAAVDGGILRFVDGAFSGNGSYLIDDDSEFASVFADFKDVAFTATGGDGDDRNNIFRVVNNGTDLDGVTFGKGILATANSLPFNIRGDVTNDGVIELVGAGSGTRLFFDHPADRPITLGGAGIVRLTGESQNFTGAVDQRLIIGPLQVIEGFHTSTIVSVGQDALLIENQGTIRANETGQTLRVEPRDSLLKNDGLLLATNGATLQIQDADTMGVGTIRADANSTVDIEGSVTSGGAVRGAPDSNIVIDGDLTQVDGLLEIDGVLTVGNFTTNRRDINILGGTIGGSGIISATDLTLSAGSTLAPSPSTEDLRLNINDFPGTAGGDLIFDFDLVSDQVFSSVDFSDNTPVAANARGGGASLAGELRLNLSGPASGFSTLPITIMKGISATVVGEVSGGGFCTTSGGDVSFSNVNFGERLTTVDGKASFIVDATMTTLTSTCSATTNDYVTTVFLTDPLFAPEFVGAPFILEIAESATVGSPVGTVVAVDPETDPVTYSLSGSGPFAIDANSGAITTTGPLDFQTQSFYTVSVTATDGTLSNTTTVTIRETGAAADNEFCVQQLLTGAGGPFEGESDPAIIGFHADPDLDGVGNVFELWTGRDPATAEFDGIGRISPLQVGPDVFAALDITVIPAVDDLLVIDGTIGTDLTGFTPGTRSVRSEDASSRALRFLSVAPAPDRAFGRFEADPEASK